jgi:hypothetical protein
MSLTIIISVMKKDFHVPLCVCVCAWQLGGCWVSIDDVCGREGKPLSFAQKHTINFHLNVVPDRPTYIYCVRVHKASGDDGGGVVKGARRRNGE